MEQLQRIRIPLAMAEVMAERGAAASTVSVADVTARARVSQTRFRELFGDREGCLLAAFELGVERAQARMVAAYGAESRWLDAIKAALAAFLVFLQEEPALGAVCVLYSMGGGEVLLHRRLEVLETLAEIIDGGCLEVPATRQPPPPVIAEGVLGAVVAVIQNRILLARERRPITELYGPLASIIVMPYLGAAVARRELERPAPRILGTSPGMTARVSGEADLPGEPVGARLTYRTARVLSAIGDYPGASNREVGERAEIVDQGQISKLLARLHERGLIAKTGEGQARGAPNSWRLTARGEALRDRAGVQSKARKPGRF